MIPVGWLAPGDQWDTNIVQRLLDGELHPHGLKVKHHTGYPNTDGCILVVPGRYWTPDRVNEAIGRYEWLLLFRTSDEEDTFDVGELEHPNMRAWVQTPRRDYSNARVFGVGFPPHFNELSEDVPVKDIDVMLVGQNTHVRRQECFQALEKTQGSQFVHATAGFTQSWREGAKPGDYAFQMMKARVAPCPSGAVSVDSFRIWEALESHAVPIADTVSPVDGLTDYWTQLFPDAPFPILTDYANLPGYVDDALRDWPRNANRITAWWMRQKRQYAHWLIDDLREVGAI